MIALDTNVLVRLLVGDDEAQLKRALTVLGPRWERSETAFLTDVVLAELEWVLDSAYSVNRFDRVAAFHQLLADQRFSFQNRSRVDKALRRYEAGRGDLSDYLLGIAASDADAESTLTFDRGLRGEPGFTVL